MESSSSISEKYEESANVNQDYIQLMQNFDEIEEDGGRNYSLEESKSKIIAIETILEKHGCNGIKPQTKTVPLQIQEEIKKLVSLLSWPLRIKLKSSIHILFSKLIYLVHKALSFCPWPAVKCKENYKYTHKSDKLNSKGHYVAYYYCEMYNQGKGCPASITITWEEEIMKVIFIPHYILSFFSLITPAKNIKRK